MLIIRTMDELARHLTEKLRNAEHRCMTGGTTGVSAAGEADAYRRALEAVRAYKTHGCDLRPANPDHCGVK